MNSKWYTLGKKLNTRVVGQNIKIWPEKHHSHPLVFPSLFTDLQVSTLPSSHSFKFQKKQGFKWHPSPKLSQMSITQVSFDNVKAYKEVKDAYKGSSLYYVSFQNFTFLIFSTSKDTLLLKKSQPFLIAFHNSTLYPSLDLQELQLFFLIGKLCKNSNLLFPLHTFMCNLFPKCFSFRSTSPIPLSKKHPIK